MKYIWIILITLFFLSGCTNKEKSAILESNEFALGDKIEITSVQGATFTFTRVEGGIVQEGKEDNVIIFDIFGTFCEPCKKEAPALMNLQLKYLDNVTLVGLSYFEDVDEKYIIENFSKPYNAHYFIAKNSDKNKILVDAITKDIGYPNLISLPFKVVLKGGKYQNVTDVWENKDGVKYYIGGINTSVIEKDLDTILKVKQVRQWHIKRI
ncbi:MAG: TlpA family protein disulfide reductase [Campylobacteraceae bacterium]|jgi:thiol-disulfide isomerase/thioredoxin|nr:TlpA family protein disulfide reductase [Campylobacteraceae bacterium]